MKIFQAFFKNFHSNQLLDFLGVSTFFPKGNYLNKFLFLSKLMKASLNSKYVDLIIFGEVTNSLKRALEILS